MFAHIFQLARFTTTGAAAALTHYSIVMLLFKRNIALHYANLVAFLLAYWVSYFGHRIFTFKAQHISHRQTLVCVAIVLTSIVTFLLNRFFAFQH